MPAAPIEPAAASSATMRIAATIVSDLNQLDIERLGILVTLLLRRAARLPAPGARRQAVAHIKTPCSPASEQGRSRYGPHARNPGNAAPSASPLSSKAESASSVGRFPDFRVVACARLPPALGKSDIKCASAHRIQWRDRGLGPAQRSIGAPPARSRVRRGSTPGCHFPFTRLRGHPPAFRYSGVTTYILAQLPILAKTARGSLQNPVKAAATLHSARSTAQRCTDIIVFTTPSVHFVMNCPTSWLTRSRPYGRLCLQLQS